MTLLEPRLEYAFEIRVDCDPSLHIGRGADEVLEYTPITGGQVSGPGLEATVLPGGADWSVTRGDTCQVDAHYVVMARDGSAIDVRNRGYYRAAPDVVARAERGEPVGEEEAYFRTAPVFQTDAPAHRWLAANQFIGLARDEDRQICIRIFKVC